ncbi:MAG: putative bifunctional diguanylate cyclase/phosphodiesterase [Hylemonella sp.]|uniref:putative bifunctional diguanylate cyclase/phosphodiesterase n=1 Tax=Hylemonella sp. TaxID=2066020 RepID=UPI00391D3BE7
MLSLLKLPIRGLFLHSRVARRVFTLFLLSALLPALLLALLAYAQMRAMDREHAQRQVELEAASYTSGLYERLLGAHFMLGVQAVSLRQGVTPDPELDGPARRVYTRIEVQPLAQSPVGSEAARAHLARGESLLLTRGEVQAPRLLLVRAVDPARPELGLLEGELASAYLWGDAEDLAHQTQVCVRDALGLVLHCTDPALRPLAERQGLQAADPQEMTQPHTTRSLFLRARFAADDWTVLVLRPAEAADAGWGRLVYLFLGVILLILLLVALLSGVQLRRTLVPLERLIEGTRRIAREDFQLPVQLQRDDEFGELGHALNKMAARLGRQMGALRALAEIDHEILARVEMEQIITRVQERLHELWPQAVTSMVVFDRQAADFGIVHLHAGEGDVTAKVPSKLEPWLLERLARDYDGMWFDVGGGELPDFLSMVADTGAQRILVLPIFWREQVSGLLAIGLMEPREFSHELVQQARDLVNRIGVALAAQARDEQLKYQAFHDALTGLPNRPLLLERLTQEMARARRSERLLAVLFIDLDRFKKINDSLGHEAGDRLLCQVAERLISSTREGDTVARLSGDEFVVLLPDLGSPQQAARLAGEMQGLLDEPFLIGDSTAYVGASIGVAIFPSDGTLAPELLKKADMAMYRAKATGRGRVVFYEESMNLAQQEQAVLERELRLAIARDQLSLRYQPRILLADNRLVGAEALLRWEHPEYGQISPEKFIPLAEEVGLIDELGHWVLQQVCVQLAQWQAAGYRITVSVNISGRQLRSGRLVQQVQQALEAAQVMPAGLELEVTEGTLIDDIEAASEQLGQIKRTGVQLSLDDFGTGYPSLRHLQQLPLDMLKIDRSFIHGLGQDDGAGSIVHSIIALAHALGKTVVAEGVEHERQAELLRIWQCEQAQGYYYSPPLTAAEIEQELTPSRPAELA